MEGNNEGPNLPSAPEKLHDNIAIWAEMVEITKKYNCMSMGAGAPGYPTPKFLKESMMKAINNDFNQYCRTFG